MADMRSDQAAVWGLVRLLRPFCVTLAAFHLLRLNEAPLPRPPAVAHAPRRKHGPVGRYFISTGATLMDGGSLDVYQFAWVWSYFQRLCMSLVSEGGWERAPGGLCVRAGDLYESRGNAWVVEMKEANDGRHHQFSCRVRVQIRFYSTPPRWFHARAPPQTNYLPMKS